MADPLAWLARRRVTLGFVCGAAALWLAQPTWATWTVGCGIALVGELVRIWAAGHLEKDREVTSSGPYRFVGHPLYLGSTIMGIGFAIAASNILVAALVALYLAATLSAAMRREQSFLDGSFGDRYRAYRSGRELDQTRRFSLERARRNREYRAVGGFVAVALILAVKVALG
ncbi:MAG TPA: methyltransferase [Vicinamibacterales bacterium]